MSTNAPIIKNPVTLDAVIGEIQKGLAERLLWLDVAFGRAQRLVKMQDGKRWVTPNVYCGGWQGHGENDYIEVSPDSHIGNFSYFEIDDPETITAGPWPREFKAPFSLVVWFDLRTIYGENDNRNTEQIKDDILHVLNGRAGWHLRGGRIVVNKVYERAENIYRGYTLPETMNQYMMHPYAGFRFEGLLEFDELCYPITPTPPEEKGLLYDRADAVVKTKDGKKVRVGDDDYTSRYSGSVMDKKFGTIGLTAVAGRRIPKENFGPVGTVRFSKSPTFCCLESEVGTEIYAPVLVELIQSGIIEPYKSERITVRGGGYVVFNNCRTVYCRFVDGGNAIKRTATGYEAMRITEAETYSRNLVIRAGRISCEKPAPIVGFGMEWKRFAFSIPVRFMIEYRRTGAGAVARQHGSSGITNNWRKKWMIATDTHKGGIPSRKIFRAGDYKYYCGKIYGPDGEKNAGACFFQTAKMNRMRLRIRAIHRNRWRSTVYSEVMRSRKK